MGLFLDASVLQNKDLEDLKRWSIEKNNIRFSFPDGFARLRLIEECRAINALDLNNPDNFDLMYDITIQMLIGKPVKVFFVNDDGKEQFLSEFVINDRYQDLRASIDIIDEYPMLVNWLVEFVAGYLGKKYPRSLQDYQVTMTERKERMKNLKKEEMKVTASWKN